ncbi:hypothetical protein [Globicatella sulfidifaciens]|uniref:Uncharacterized protein n=1 Tax=Globicatella sulfidifaciens TaxID=136093 RepID=A0A7X8GZQ7_9LACT|nr:hypothetical protein [Globicatella sulfidifaciens]NLJ17696.1 hypothetical protein [Globicatella sulfidifaciens]
MVRVIKIVDFLCGNCKYLHCAYNEDGMCLNREEEFLLEISEVVSDAIRNNMDNLLENTFKCYAETSDEICEYCGERLITYEDCIPYGDGYTFMPGVYCPRCDK